MSGGRHAGADPVSVADNYRGAWGSRIGFGRRPLLLMVDFMRAYTTPGAPLFAEGVVTAVTCAARLLRAARELGTPILHTNILYREADCADGGIWVQKAPVMRAMRPGNELAEFCVEVSPLPSEPVVTKQYASAFFGTSLASQLYARQVDTVVIAGCSTSGCVRATAVDAVQHGFRVIVVRECVGDRHPGPHEANLFDIDAKYGDVIMLDSALAELTRLSNIEERG